MAQKFVTLVSFASDEGLRRQPIEEGASASVVCGTVIDDVVHVDDTLVDVEIQDDGGQDFVRLRHRSLLVPLDRDPFEAGRVEVDKELGQAGSIDEEMHATVCDIGRERDASEDEVEQFPHTDGDFPPVPILVQCVRQPHCQNMVRRHQHGVVASKSLDLSGVVRRVADELDGVSRSRDPRVDHIAR